MGCHPAKSDGTANFAILAVTRLLQRSDLSLLAWDVVVKQGNGNGKAQEKMTRDFSKLPRNIRQSRIFGSPARYINWNEITEIPRFIVFSRRGIN